MRRVLLVAALACAALLVLSAAAMGATNAKAGPQLQPTGPDYNAGKAKPLPAGAASKMLQRTARGADRTAAANTTPAVGTQRTWFANDDTDFVYLKVFTLRAVSAHMEVWVANDLQFPAGDCRNGPRTVVTDADVNYFVNEFETNIYPKESATFSVPPARDGSQINETCCRSRAATRTRSARSSSPATGRRSSRSSTTSATTTSTTRTTRTG